MYLAENLPTQSIVQKYESWMQAADKALVVVDVQNDFLETGALPVKDGSEVIPAINKLLPKFDVVAVTQDWHPEEHISYATSHQGKNPYETTDVSYGKQALWPEHCKAGTKGAELATGLALTGNEHYIKKGTEANFDCYSAIKDATGKEISDLVPWLHGKDIAEVYVCGLATDFCVCETAIDLAKAGFKTFIVTDASRPVDVNGSLEKAEEKWKEAGVSVINTADLLKTLQGL